MCSPSSFAEELDSYSGVCNALEQASSAASLPLRTPPIHNLKSSPSVSSASLRASPPLQIPLDHSQGQSLKTGHHGHLSLRPFSESATLSSSLQVLCTQEHSPHHCHRSAPPSPPLTLGRRRWRPPAPLRPGSSPPTGSRTAR